jgi:hypothetical protein
VGSRWWDPLRRSRVQRLLTIFCTADTAELGRNRESPTRGGRRRSGPARGRARHQAGYPPRSPTQPASRPRSLPAGSRLSRARSRCERWTRPYARAQLRRQKLPICGAFLKRMKGLEPSTFCMASARDVRTRSRTCAPSVLFAGSSFRRANRANPSERRTLPFLPRLGPGANEARGELMNSLRGEAADVRIRRPAPSTLRRPKNHPGESPSAHAAASSQWHRDLKRFGRRAND